MPESAKEMLNRVWMMSNDSGTTWDLSPNDQAALKYVLDRIEDLERILSDANTDLFHWIQLAERQRVELPNADHLPCAPTALGICASKHIRKLIADVLKRN